MSKIEESAVPPMPWVDGNSRVFGVIAHPVTHVRAPMVFNPRFAASGLGHIMVPAETKWLQDAARRGLRVHYGRHMLDYQIELIGKFIGAF